MGGWICRIGEVPNTAFVEFGRSCPLGTVHRHVIDARYQVSTPFIVLNRPAGWLA